MAKTKKTTQEQQETTGFMDTPEWELPQIPKLKYKRPIMFINYSLSEIRYLEINEIIDSNHENYKEWHKQIEIMDEMGAQAHTEQDLDKRDILLKAEEQSLLTQGKIPLPLTERGIKFFANYAELFNFFYQLIDGKTGIGKFLREKSIINVPNVKVVFEFLELHHTEIKNKEMQIPPDNNTKRIFFDYLKTILIERTKNEITTGLTLRLLKDGFFTLDRENHKKLWSLITLEDRAEYLRELTTPDKAKEYQKEADRVKEIEKELYTILEKFTKIKNPYSVTQALTTTEYAGAKAPSGKIEQALLFSKGNFVEGTLAGLHFTANIAGVKPTKAELFDTLQIFNLYLHKDTENMDLTQTTPLFIPYKEIQIAKRGEIPDSKSIKLDREAKKFEERLRNIVTRRIKFKIDYTKQEAKNKKYAKTQEVLFNRYNTIPEETYLLQADFRINPETGEKYLAITNKCIFLELCKQSNWIITIPHHYYNSELTKALSMTNLSEDAQATAYFLFMQLVSLVDDKVKRVLAKKGNSNKITREIINDTELPPIKVRYDTLYNYGNTIKDEYNTLSKVQKQRFRESIFRTLEAFGKIAINHPEDFIEHPFLTLLIKEAEKKIYYKEYSDPATNATIGIELAFNKTYKENFTNKMQNSGLLTTPPKAIKKKAKQ